jgi:hypothetical protein
MNIMKQVAIKSTVDMLQKIETIEKEVMDLKVSVLKRLAPTDKRVISLKGVLKNVDITEEDITSVKKSLYSKTGLYGSHELCNRHTCSPLVVHRQP